MTTNVCPGCGRPIGHEFATASLHCSVCLLRAGLPPRASTAAESVLDYLRMVNVIGEGPRGRVFLAEWTTPGAGMVAIKCAAPRAGAAAGDAHLTGIDHPGIATIHEVGTTSRLGAYAITDYVPGTAITRFCEREHLSSVERIDLWLQAADAVAYAHACGFLHLNLKPNNLLVSGRIVSVLDFEGALPVREPAPPGPYRAPEQDGGTAPDPRSDVFALGAVLDDLVGRRADAVLVEAIARHAMRPDPGERPQSVAALADEVRTAADALQT